MNHQRLPTTVRPRHYDLELVPDLAGATFDGVVRIDVEVDETTDEIILNAAELAVHSVTVRTGECTEFVGQVRTDDEHERLHIDLPTTLAAGGTARLEIAFSGVLNDRLRGFYRSTFVDSEGCERTIATTQFEATSARRAFPCWDEPELKATFSVTLVVASDLLAISSGAEISRTPVDDDQVAVRFERTMLMSTYLLAFIVGPLEATEAIDVDGVPLRVVHAIGKGHLAEYALEVGAFSLRHFSTYFDIAYPGGKLDLVAVPDFASGAMENMGCVTFREAVLLVDPETSTQADQRLVATVIAHEIAHMWFGNLVTMTWWNGLWLKEAFATFCEIHATDAWRPQWQRWAEFGLSRTAAFDTDALWSTRAIEFPVRSPDEADAMFDILTYEKGAAIVRMLEQYLGADRFRDGIRHYLATHSYGNADTGDLWDAIEMTSGEPVRETMDGWIFQGGHPVITVDRPTPFSLTMRQERFAYSEDRRPGDSGTPSPHWLVPMVITTAAAGIDDRSDQAALLGEDTLEITTTRPIAWAIANTGGNGFYRTRYVGDLLSDVLAAHHDLAPVERYGFVDDAWATLVSGRQSLGDYRSMVNVIADDEVDIAIWRRLAATLVSIDRHVSPDDRPAHRAWVWALVSGAFNRVGRVRNTDEVVRAGELRAALLGLGGELGQPQLIAEARAVHPDPSDPDRNAAAIDVIASAGTAADFADFAERYRSAATPQDERRYLGALARFPDASQMHSLLSLIENDRVRAQDATMVLGAAIANVDQGALAWHWVTENWDLVNDRYPASSISRLVAGVGSIADPTLAREVVAFFADHPVPQAGPTLDQAIERMGVTVAFRQHLRSTSS